MNPRDEKLRSLLDDVLPASADHCGPDQSRILAMARHEQSRLRQIRAALTTVAVLAAVASIIILGAPSRPGSMPPVAVSPVALPPLVIHPIDDDGLFAVLQSTPSAIMEFPNGDRAVLVVTGGDY
jgi:hypothetical protein